MCSHEIRRRPRPAREATVARLHHAYMARRTQVAAPGLACYHGAMRNLLLAWLLPASACVHVQVGSPNDPNIVIAPAGDANVVLPPTEPQQPARPLVAPSAG